MEWTKEQEQAIYKKGSNILVAAAAGSGKTAVLVERIINKIINNIVKINTDTDIRLAFTSKLRKFLTQHPEDIDVRKMLIEGKREATETVKYKIEKIFDSKNKK